MTTDSVISAADDTAIASGIDPDRVRRNFARAATKYDAVAVLQREIAAHMFERLDCVKIDPKCIVDLGCGTGSSLPALGERYASASIVGIDSCEAMLRIGQRRRSHLRWMLPFLRGPKTSSLVAADAHFLPLKEGVAGLVWSNLMLHWLTRPLAAFREMHRVMEVGGLLMFSTFGPDTLKELRTCFMDGYEHTLRFVDMHDYGDMLIECGFSDPVMDVERMTMTYASLDDLFRELRQNGGSCALRTQRQGLMGRQTWRDACDAYEKLRSDGRLPVTFEVVHGHAWKAEPGQIADGRNIIRFDPKRRPADF